MKKTIYSLILPAVFLCLADCSLNKKEKAGIYFDEEKFAEQKSLYEIEPLSSYTLTYSFDRGDAFPPYEGDGTLVRDKDSYTLTFSKNDGTGDSIPDSTSRYYIKSIDDLFSYIQKEYEEGSDFCSRYPDEYRIVLTVEYDEEYHFPVTVETEIKSVEDSAVGFGNTGIKVKAFSIF